MKVEELEDAFTTIVEAVSKSIAMIEAKENEIASITERLEEIGALSDPETKAQKVRAKEKRAHLRDEIVALRERVRVMEAKKDWLMMMAKSLIEKSVSR